jgi:hypothetical protein
MRDPSPTVVLIPGLGMVAWGKDKSESRVTAEFYNCAIEVMRGASVMLKTPQPVQRVGLDGPGASATLIGQDHVRAEIGQVLAGLAPGRLSDEEITLFKSVGNAVEDLAVAALVLG